MTEFNVHLNSDHGEEKEKDITCKVCDLKFKREFDMQIHNSAKHSVKSFGFTATKEKKAFLFPNIPLKWIIDADWIEMSLFQFSLVCILSLGNKPYYYYYYYYYYNSMLNPTYALLSGSWVGV